MIGTAVTAFGVYLGRSMLTIIRVSIKLEGIQAFEVENKSKLHYPLAWKWFHCKL